MEAQKAQVPGFVSWMNLPGCTSTFHLTYSFIAHKAPLYSHLVSPISDHLTTFAL